MSEIKVAVSGINAVDNPGPGVGVAKSIKEWNPKAKIVGLAYDPMEPGVYMKWLIDKSYLMPYPSQGADAFIQRLLYIKENYGLDAVIPTLDAELPIYIEYAQRLKDFQIASFLPTKEQFRLRSKERLNSVAQKIGIKAPKTFSVIDYAGLRDALKEVGYPAMVKGLFYKAYKVYTYEEAVEKFNEIVAQWGYPVLVQEVVKGEELNLVGVGDGEGGHFGFLNIKKLWITQLGKIWTGVTIRNPKMISAAENFVREFKWRGAFELECIYTPEGEVYLIEINPRFPAWVYFATGAGVNLPARLLMASLGEEPPRDWDYEVGKLYVRFSDDFVTDMGLFQRISTYGEV
ncbi:MAG: carboxylate--amine ligase [Gammaproteobacteria bacterium]|nr:MAG: carboxylate--amine ligase [Gammaproteobacteria bacterium]